MDAQVVREAACGQQCTHDVGQRPCGSLEPASRVRDESMLQIDLDDIVLFDTGCVALDHGQPNVDGVAEEYSAE